MTKQEIEAIRAREQAATPGPWEICDTDQTRNYILFAKPANGIADIYQKSRRKENGEFIDHARQDIPALLEALDHWKARAEALERAMKSYGEGCAPICYTCNFYYEYEGRGCDRDHCSWKFDEARFAKAEK